MAWLSDASVTALAGELGLAIGPELRRVVFATGLGAAVVEDVVGRDMDERNALALRPLREAARRVGVDGPRRLTLLFGVIYGSIGGFDDQVCFHGGQRGGDGLGPGEIELRAANEAHGEAALGATCHQRARVLTPAADFQNAPQK